MPPPLTPSLSFPSRGSTQEFASQRCNRFLLRLLMEFALEYVQRIAFSSLSVQNKNRVHVCIFLKFTHPSKTSANDKIIIICNFHFQHSSIPYTFKKIKKMIIYVSVLLYILRNRNSDCLQTGLPRGRSSRISRG